MAIPARLKSIPQEADTFTPTEARHGCPLGSSRRARSNGMSTKRYRKSGPPFIRLFRFVKRSQAYHDLSLPAPD
jgi:hypothetical protein